MSTEIPQNGVTPAIFAQLSRVFRLDEHEMKDSKLYIVRHAILKRLTEVDPEWRVTVDKLERQQDVIIVIGTLTICGVSRQAVSAVPIRTSKEGYAQAEALANTYKAASSALIQRGAQLFGVGMYLKMKDAPRDLAALAKFIADLNKGKPDNGSSAPSTPPASPTRPASKNPFSPSQEKGAGAAPTTPFRPAYNNQRPATG